MKPLLLLIVFSVNVGKVPAQSDCKSGVLPEVLSIAEGLNKKELMLGPKMVLPSQKCVSEFLLRNDSPSDFRISEAKVSCGCLNVSSEAALIPKDGVGKIRFAYESPSTDGDYRLVADFIDDTRDNRRKVRVSFDIKCRSLVRLVGGRTVTVDGRHPQMISAKVCSDFEGVELNGLDFNLRSGPFKKLTYGASSEDKTRELLLEYSPELMGEDAFAQAVVDVRQNGQNACELSLMTVVESRFKITPAIPVFRLRDEKWLSRIVLHRPAGSTEKIEVTIVSPENRTTLDVATKILNRSTQIVNLSLPQNGRKSFDGAKLLIKVEGHESLTESVSFLELE